MYITKPRQIVLETLFSSQECYHTLIEPGDILVNIVDSILVFCDH